MSGGHFGYDQYKLHEIKDEIERLSQHSYSPETINNFKDAIKVLAMAQIYVQRIDWLVCGDDSEESFLARLNTELTDLINSFYEE